MSLSDGPRARRRPFVLAGLAIVIVAAIAIVGFHSHGHAHGDIRVVDAAGNVQVLGEWRLGSSQGEPLAAIASGDLRFELSNADAIAHNFVLLRTEQAGSALPTDEGHVDLEHAGEVVGGVEALAPGAQGSHTFNLQPGNYVLYCNIEGHYQGGMYYQLTVE